MVSIGAPTTSSMSIRSISSSSTRTSMRSPSTSIENTGPDLTPQRMAAVAPTMGTIGGGTTGHYEVGFRPGGFSWTQDCEVVYWDPNRVSSYNGQPGTYVPIEGSRFQTGQFPRLPEPPVPATRS